jgi:hypothetical protein
MMTAARKLGRWARSLKVSGEEICAAVEGVGREGAAVSPSGERIRN